MPEQLKIPIKPEWLGDEALARSKKFTEELEKQKQFFKNNPKYQRQQFAQIFADITAQEKKVRDWSKAFGDVFKQIGGEKKKIWDDFFARNETGMDRLIKKTRDLRQDLSTAFEVSTTRGLGFTLNKVTGGIETALSKVFNLKNALLATAVGGVTYGLASRALRGGLGNVRDDARIRREFSGSLAGGVRSSVEELASAAGIEGGDALAALTPIARAIKETRVGSRLRSGRRLTSQSQVDAVQRQTLGLATNYTKRLLTVMPDASPEDIGRILAEAGTGEEGLGSLARFVGLGRASLNDILSESKKKKLAIGDVVGKILERGGITEKAAEDQRHTFDFQIKSIGSQLSDALGNVGTSAIERLNKSLGEGTTLAEKLSKYLSSEEGKKTIDALGDSLAKVVSFTADLAKKIPDVIKFISEHKGTLLAIGGVFGAAKIGGGILGAVGGAKELINAARGATPATPLFVTQVGGVPGAGGGGAGLLGKASLVVGAGLAGYAAGTWLDNKLGLSDKISHISDSRNKANEEQMSATYRQLLADKNARRELQVQRIMDTTGMSRGQALYAADHPGWQPPQVNVQVHMDGKQIAHHSTTEVRRQQVSQARNEAGM